MVKQKNKSVLSILKKLAELITILGVISGIGYGVGRWQSYIEYKTEIMEIRQTYNVEISNLKIDYNSRIAELQNEIKIMKLSNN